MMGGMKGEKMADNNILILSSLRHFILFTLH